MFFIYLTTLFCALVLSALLFFVLHVYGHSLKKRLYDTLHKNFYFLRDYHIEYWFIYFFLFVFFISYFVFEVIVYAVLFTLLSLVFLYFLLNTINSYIERKIEREIPSFLRLLAASLQAGQSLQSALKDTVQSIQGPLKKEMSYVLRELQIGLSFNEALSNLRTRMPSPSISMMAISLQVASQSGASIADLLHELASSINQKIELHYKVQALSLQGRLQAYVLTAVPYIMLAVLYWVGESWITPFNGTLLGNADLGFCLLMSVVGFYFIKIMVNINV